MRPERSCDSLLAITLALASVAGCSFDPQGLVQTGGETQGSSGPGGASSSGSSSVTSTGPGEPTTGSAASTAGEASASGESGSTGPVDPTTGVTTTTTDPTTGTATTTTSGDDSTTAADSSTGCTEQPFYKDGDNDGFGDPKQVMMACDAPDGFVADDGDCNDKDVAVNPDAQEVCLGGDDDCDGKVDEFNPPMNIDCGGCRMVLYQPNNRVYHFCKAARKWDDARGDCEKRDAMLAKDLDDAHHDWLLAQVGDNSGPWFIGADAEKKDEVFVWLADMMVVAADDTRWGLGQPSGGGNTNKLALVANNNLGFWLALSGKWADRGENDAEPFICEGPFE